MPVHNASGVAPASPGRREGVQLVEEQDARGGHASLREDLPHVPLRLSNIHVKELQIIVT